MAVPAVMDQVRRLLIGIPLSEIHIIWEDSQRLNQELGAAFSKLGFLSSAQTKIPTTYSILPKASCEPGLELADCIIHTAGCQVRNRMKGATNVRRDFEAVFKSRSPAESAFIEITDFRHEPSKP